MTGENIITIESIENLPEDTKARLCFYKKNDVYFCKDVTTSMLPININLNPDTLGDVRLTVTALNFKPVSKTLIVESNINSPHLYVSNIIIDDQAGGNGDGRIDAGEEILMQIELTNTGVTAQNINSQLTHEIIGVSESFENGFPPAGWQNPSPQYWFQNEGTHHPLNYESFDGDKLTYFAAYQNQGIMDILLTNGVYILNSTIKLRMFHDNGYPNCHDLLNVVLMGNFGSFTNIAQYERYNNGSPNWDPPININLNSILPSVNNSNQVIGFMGISDNGNDIHIDSVQISSYFATIDENQNTSNFGSIQSGSSSLSQSNYLTTIYENVNDQAEFPCDLGISVENPELNITDNFDVRVKAPVIQLERITFQDQDGDHTIGPNDTISLYIDLLNKGFGEAMALSDTLETFNPDLIEIITGKVETGDIPSFENSQNAEPLKFYVDENYNGESLTFTLTVRNSYGKEWKFEFVLDKPTIECNINYLCDQNEIFIYWPPSENVKGYNIYRWEDNSWVRLNDRVIENYSGYTETDLEVNTEYKYQLCSVSNDGVESDPCEFTAWTSIPCHDGWPVETDPSLGSLTKGCPATGDIDQDGTKEIFVTTYQNDNSAGSVLGYYEDGTKIFDNDAGFYIFDAAVKSTPSLALVNGDDSLDLIVTTAEGLSGGTSIDRRNIFIFSTAHQQMQSNPELLCNKWISGPNSKGPVVGNLCPNVDNNLEMTSVSEYGDSMYVFNYLPNHTACEILYEPDYPENAENGMPAVADLDSDGNLEIIVGYRSGIYVYTVDQENNQIVDYRQNPFYNAGCSEGWVIDSPPVVADLNNDGKNDIIFISGLPIVDSNGIAKIVAINSLGYTLTGWGDQDHVVDLSYEVSSIKSSVSVGDLNNDNHLEVVFGDASKLYIWDYQGNTILEKNITNGVLNTQFIAPILADLDSDDEIEILLASRTGQIFAFNPDGSDVFGFPFMIGDGIEATPCVDDIDFDGKNEIIATAASMNPNTGIMTNKTFVWDTEGDADKIEWGSYRHDNYNSGFYGLNLCTYNEYPLEINANVTWNNDTCIYQDIIVNSGATLTIHSRVALPGDASIIVKRGAMLVVDGGTITNACKGLWRGIEVYGTSNQPQQPNYQGTVVVENGGTIEHAETGIRAYRTLTDGHPDYAYTGGIVIGDSGNFIDNKTGIEFPDYRLYSMSLFKNCNFITTGLLPGKEEPDYFIKMTGMTYIHITRCTFENTSEYGFYGDGIYSLNSTYFIDHGCIVEHSPCPGYETCKFIKLHRGIYATDDGTNTYVDIRNSDFINNERGIYISGIDGARITSNYFLIPTPDRSLIEIYGLYMNESTGYHVEDDEFVHDGDNLGFMGIYVRKSGTAYNSIYNNFFNNLKYGIIADDKNRHANYEGLCIKCNDFTNCEWDILITVNPNQPASQDYGIAYNQGVSSLISSDDTAAAGNRFSDPPWLYANIDNAHFCNWVNYYFHSQTPPPSDKLIPNPALGAIYLEENENSFYSKEGSCPSKLEGGGGEGKEKMDEASYTIEIKESALQVLVDGGNTEELNNAIFTSFPDEALEVTQQLLDDSPYLSDTVMKSAIFKENVFPNAMVRDVLVANPHSAKSKEILQALDEKTNPMSDDMIAEIIQGQTVTGAKEALESEIAFWRQQRSRIYGELFHLYRNDTTNSWAKDSLIDLLQNVPDLQAKYSLVYQFLKSNEINQASIVLYNIPQNMEMNGDEQQEYDYFVALFDILLQERTDTTGLCNIDSTQIETLFVLSENDQYLPGVYARNILINLKKMVYDEPFNIPDPLKSLKPNTNFRNETKPQVTNTLLKVFPNPAKNYIVIDYDAGEIGNHIMITISDMTGKLIFVKTVNKNHDQIIVPIINWDEGIYLVRLIINNKIENNTKFVLLK